MKVRDIMSRDVEVARPDETLREVAQKMADCDIGSLPVCDGRKIQGMITDRDIAIRAVAQGRGPDTTAASVMSAGVEYCFEDDDLDEVCAKMSDRQIRRIPVVDADRNLVGIVSLGDIAVEGADENAAEALENISQPGGVH